MSNSISDETVRSLTPAENRPSIIYGFCKVHEDVMDNCLPFGPILSTVKTPTKKTQKNVYYLQYLKSLTSYECTVKDSLRNMWNKILNF